MGREVHLFYEHMQIESLQTDIEQRLATADPDVEVLACEQLGRERVRLFIDHPDGVDLALCERVTKQLGDLLAEYGLEVSSPGPERPLSKPDHFRRYLGRRARLRLREPRDGHRTFTGELVGASDEEVTVAADTGVVSIPYSEINRSNLLPEAAGGRAGNGIGER
ncbi:MAG: ribosome maturation factor RimP [Thermoleophilaceae bacterium]|nr:ribosome maturation factor RimP [Thermoleophilaceae bacterium]